MRNSFAILLTALSLIFVLPLKAATFDQNHSLWNDLLQAHVKDHGTFSQVDYKTFKTEEVKLDRYLASITSLQQSEFNSWSRDQQLACLINAYNAFTVKLILENYPVKSIKDIGSFFTNSWKKKFFKLFGEESFLDHIEHDLIRADPKFDEPRIHFALVCASIGCPKLHNKAFTSQNLETLLESGAQSFLTDTSRNRYIAEKRLLQLSKIFDWYGEDFEKKFGSVTAFVAKYVTTKPAEQTLIAQGKIKLEHLDYNWALNDVL